MEKIVSSIEIEIENVDRKLKIVHQELFSSGSGYHSGGHHEKGVRNHQQVYKEEEPQEYWEYHTFELVLEDALETGEVTGSLNLNIALGFVSVPLQ